MKLKLQTFVIFLCNYKDYLCNYKLFGFVKLATVGDMNQINK